MDVEQRLLLYVVVLGCAFGVASLVGRRSSAFHAYAFQLVMIAAAAVAGLVREDLGARIGWPLFAAWLVVAAGPPLLVSAGRRAAGRRSYDAASRCVGFAAALLLLPRPLRREARLYAAFGASDRGDEEGCAERLADLSRLDGARPVPETEDLAAILPAATSRRWGDVLRAVDASVRRGPVVLAAEVAAAAETGDVRRAIRAVTELSRLVPPGAPALAQARRTVLGAAGRAAFLEEAIREGLPVADGPPGGAEFALGRAYEALGEAEPAQRAYEAAAAAGRGLIRREAAEGRARCVTLGLRRSRPDELETAALHDLEHACRTEVRDPTRKPLFRRAPATLIACTATSLVSGLALALLGDDMVGLVAAGALSAPLVEAEGQWWRLASAMLVHGGPVHLLLNVASIAVIGIPYEERSGSVRTTIVYLASGLVASGASAFGNGTDIGVGASGAAMGLFGALCLILVIRPHLFEASERRRWLASCAAVLVSNAAIGWVESEAIDNAAHLGGTLAGAVIAWVLLPAPFDAPLHRGARRLFAAGLLTVLAVSCGAVLADVRQWTTPGLRRFRGVTIELPAWVRTSDEGTLGTVGLRRPLPFIVAAGRSGTAWPDVHRLAAMLTGADEADVHRWQAGATTVQRDAAGVRRETVWAARPRDAGSDDVALASGPPVPLRAVVLERAGVWAAAVLPDDANGARSFGPVVRRLAATLAPSDGDPPR